MLTTIAVSTANSTATSIFKVANFKSFSLPNIFLPICSSNSKK